MRNIDNLFNHINSNNYLKYNDINMDLYIDGARNPVKIRSLADGLVETVHNDVTDIGSTLGIKIKDKDFFILLFEAK